MWRLSSLLVLAILAACATTAAQAVPATPPPQLGVLYGDRSTWLVRIDPDTLHVLAGTRLAVGGHTFGWSYSSDGARLALGGDLHYLAIPSVLVVDTRRLRALGQVRLA